MCDDVRISVFTSVILPSLSTPTPRDSVYFPFPCLMKASASSPDRKLWNNTTGGSSEISSGSSDAKSPPITRANVSFILSGVRIDLVTSGLPHLRSYASRCSRILLQLSAQFVAMNCGFFSHSPAPAQPRHSDAVCHVSSTTGGRSTASHATLHSLSMKSGLLLHSPAAAHCLHSACLSFSLGFFGFFGFLSTTGGGGRSALLPAK